MNKNEYEKMRKEETFYWWHVGRIYFIKQYLKLLKDRNKIISKKRSLKIFELGCGTGEVTKELLKFGKTKSIDISPEAIEACLSLGLEAEQADIVSMETGAHVRKYDIAVALDVLEHIRDDVTAIKKIHKILNKNGHFIITVPAYKFLWSEHDEALHHCRRYHTFELQKKLEQNGFEIVKKSHFVFTAFVPIVFFRFWNNIFGRRVQPKTSYVHLPKFLNDFAINVLKVESKIINKISLPVGTTLFFMARKI